MHLPKITSICRGAGKINSHATFGNGSHIMRIRKQGPVATPPLLTNCDLNSTIL